MNRTININNSQGFPYRFGFNGMEKDDEVNGVSGANYTAEFWEYDARIGRRWNTDPISYAWQSPYACFNNNPIYFVDPSGLEAGNDDPVKKGDDLKDAEGKDIKDDKGNTIKAGIGEIQIDGRTSGETNNPKKDDEIHSETEDNSNIKVAVGAAKDIVSLIAKIKGGMDFWGKAGKSMKIQNLVTKTISPGDIVGCIIPFSGKIVAFQEEKWDKQDFDFSQEMAQKDWQNMKIFAKRYNTNNQTSVIFVYAAEDVHEGILNALPTTIVYQSKEEASRELGFVPNVVYYKFIDKDTKIMNVSTTKKLKYK